MLISSIFLAKHSGYFIQAAINQISISTNEVQILSVLIVDAKFGNLLRVDEFYSRSAKVVSLQKYAKRKRLGNIKSTQTTHRLFHHF